MDLSIVLVFLLYGAAIAFIIYFIMNQNTSTPVIIQQESPITYASDDSAWWPWGSGTYNYWPYWGGWWSGGGNGGYEFWQRGGPRIHPGPRPRFGGGPRGQLGGALPGRTMGGMTGGHGGGRGGGGRH